MDNYSNRKNLIKIAKLYYVADMSQQEIAQLMGISRPKVSRMISLAKKMGVVQITVCAYPNMREELEEKLKDLLGLKTVIVTESSKNAEKCKQHVARAAAQYLQNILTDHMRIALEWGTTTEYMVQQFTGKSSCPGVEVLQMSGSTHLSDHHLDGRELVRTLAKKIGGTYQILQYPMVVKSALLAEMILEFDNKEYFDKMAEADLAIVGLGSNIPEESATYMGGYITLEESKALIAQGYGADICGHRLQLDGTAADSFLRGRVISPSLATIRNFPRTIAIGCGEQKKESIIASARGGYITDLVVDELAAISIISLLEQNG